MKPFVRLLAALLCVLLLPTCSGCRSGSSTADKNIRITLDVMPDNIDPQLASTDEELLIVRNSFEGLFRIDNEKVVPAACESYTVSEDALTYVFTLREGLKWSDGTDLTADDFRFGLIRALRPETLSPDAHLLFAIRNGAEVYAGTADESTLGIRTEGDRTLILELSQPDSGLLEILSYALAMPCSRTMFEKAGGRYGMSPSLTLCNGPFVLSQWTESTVKLTRNGEYVGNFTALPAAVTLTFSGADSERIEKINTDFTDIARIRTQSVTAAKDALLDTVLFYDTVWALVIRPDAKVIGDAAVSAALKKALDTDTLRDELPDNFVVTDRIIADDLLVGMEPYRNYAGEGFPASSDSAGARDDLIAALKPFSGKLPTITILYENTDGMQHTATFIAQIWQKELGAVVNIEACSASELKDAMEADNYQVALCPISTDNGKAVSAVACFDSRNSRNRFGFAAGEVDSQIDALSLIDDSNRLYDALEQINRRIVSDSHILPLAQSGTCYAVSSDVVGVQFDRNPGRIALYRAGR